VTDPARTAAIILAAGAGTRFGGGKLLAELGGRPILDRVLATLADAGLAEMIVVVGPDAEPLEAIAIARGARIVRNQDPGRGLSSSVQAGLGALTQANADHSADGIEAALIALGDQPLTARTTVVALLDAPVPAGRRIVVPRYAGGGGQNPALVLRAAWPLASELRGDRGFGPIIQAHPDLVVEVDLPTDNPDVDTPGDLARLVAARWAARVEANRAQVERVREVPDGPDFYAPVRSLFRADPARTDDPTLAALLELARPGDRWLDVGAGAGRYALPLGRWLAPSGGEVGAIDASASMLAGLREIAAEHLIANVRTIEARWPPDGPPDALAGSADVALIAHVGYDVAAILPFVVALEAVARRACVAVLMERVPASAADPFWPQVHGEERLPLPALADFLELLAARRKSVSVSRLANPGRSFASRAELAGFVRRQLWIDPTGAKEARFQDALDELAVEANGTWTIAGRQANQIGIVSWQP
jgi:CTP:molybdopterin cytidylyltransferase MocA/SAM-dependent methyltransferase